MTHDPGLASWLRITLAPGLGAVALRELLKSVGLPEQILASSRSSLAGRVPAAFVEALRSERVDALVSTALEWEAEDGHAILALDDARYPPRLLETADPPTLLYCAGDPALLVRPSIAVVGSRNASAQGLRDAEKFARALSQWEICVVSGLALGIDAAAHRGGLAGAGSTIAVLGTGLDVSYPKGNAELERAIRARGLLVAEFPLGTPPLAGNFPRRNRLISGLSHGCLVVEAAVSSGSLITARLAADQGREVFAIPGSIHSPLSKGCHALIKSGAKLVESVDDIVGELPALRPHGAKPTHDSRAAADDGDPFLQEMGFAPVNVDSLCERTGLSAAEVSARLLTLELCGKVATLPGGLFQRIT